MPGARCTVAVCNNSYTKTKKLPPDRKIVYHTFPTDTLRRQKWIQLCLRAGKWNPDSCTVCSVHFKPEDYERDLKAELLNIPPKKTLRSSALPSLFLLPKDVIANPAVNRRTSRHKRRLQREIVETILTNVSNTSEPSTEIGDLEAPFTHDSPTAPVGHQFLSVNDVEDGTSQLKMQIKYLQAANRQIKAKLYVAEKKLSYKGIALSSLKKEVQQLQKEKAKSKILHTHVREALSTVFTESQIKCLVQKQKKVHWDSNSISIAFTLRYLSKRAYVFLRNKLNYPLPGLSSLNRWASSQKMRQGILEDVINSGQAMTSEPSANEKTDGGMRLP